MAKQNFQDPSGLGIASDEAGKSRDGDAPTFALVATTRFLLLVDLVSKQVTPLEAHRPEYYGVSWFPDSVDLVLSHSHLDNAALRDVTAYSQSEVGNLSHGPIATPTFLSSPHQILCAPDGRVICTNTGRNALTVVDLSKPTHFQEVRVSEARWDRLSIENIIGDHLNSVFLKNDLLYVVAHGHSKGSQLVTLSYPELEIVAIQPIKNRTGLHNIWVTDDQQKITCNSSAGALYELNENRTLWSSGCPVYTRGLAASASFVLVGESECSARDLRRSSMSGLWLIDRSTWQELDYFCLGPFGVVHEVRLLNVRDEAHHGHPFLGIDKLIKKNLVSEVVARKMRTACVERRSAIAWQGFEVVFGVTAVDEHGARTSGPGDLCLLTQSTASAGQPGRMTFRYSLEGAGNESHVSVVNYRGRGGDTDMHALLIQPISNHQAHLSLWVHDGQAWAMTSDLDVAGLPMRADAEVVTGSHGTKLYIDRKMVAHLRPNILPLDHGSLGLRWMGASVLPLSAAS